MVDPVGLVAIGIEACKFLAKYYADYKSYNKDINEACSSASALMNTFALIANVVQTGATSRISTAVIAAHVLACENGISELQRLADSFSKMGVPSDFRDKVNFAFDHARYPFKASTLAKYRTTVHGLMQPLDLALGILQVEATGETHTLIRDVRKSLTATIDRIDASTTATEDIVHSMDAKVDDLGRSVNFVMSGKKFESFEMWVAAPDPTDNHNDAVERCQSGTGQWLLRSSEYLAWRDGVSSSPLLWLYGLMGCCKTVLCSTIIEDVRSYTKTRHLVHLAYFYFSFTDVAKQSYRSLLLSIIDQLVRSGVIVQELDVARKKNDKSIPTLEGLVRLLIETTSRSYIVIDAMDECPQHDNTRRNLLEGIKRLSDGIPNLRILMTSRAEEDIRVAMRKYAADALELPAAAIDRDIAIYVDFEISQDSRLKRLPHTTKEEIKAAFAQKAGGMFRWAYLQLETLKRIKIMRPQKITQVLHSLPLTLYATYEQMLSSLEDQDEATTALRWLVFSGRPLTLKELQEACLITYTPDPYVDEASREAMDGLLDALGSLVSTYDAKPEANPSASSGNERLVRLAHFSVQEYLRSPQIRCASAKAFALEENLSHSILAQSCVAYLLFYKSLNHCAIANVSPYNTDCFPPLLEYSLGWWARHQSIAEISCPTHVQTAPDLVLDLFISHGFRLLTTDEFLSAFRNVQDLDRGVNPLHFAVQKNLPRTLQARLDSGLNINTPNRSGETPVHLACQKERTECFDLLMSRGCDVNTSNPLLVAPKSSSSYFVRKLLEAGAEVNASRYGRTALVVAAMLGSEECVSLLLAAGANFGAFVGTSLVTVCQMGHATVARLLLAAGAEVNAGGGQPLIRASEAGHVTVVEMIIGAGANVNVDEGEPLIRSSRNGHITVVERLVAAGANVEAKRWKSLFAAFHNGHSTIVKKLLAANPDFNAAVVAACANRHQKALTWLMKNGADLRVCGNAALASICVRSESPAVGRGHTNEMCDILLRAGVDPSATHITKDGIEQTPLVNAVESGYNLIVDSLLQHGEDPNRCDHRGSPLEVACLSRYANERKLFRSIEEHRRDQARAWWVWKVKELARIHLACIPMAKSLLAANSDVTCLTSPVEVWHNELVQVLHDAGVEDVQYVPIHIGDFYTGEPRLVNDILADSKYL